MADHLKKKSKSQQWYSVSRVVNREGIMSRPVRLRATFVFVVLVFLLLASAPGFAATPVQSQEFSDVPAGHDFYSAVTYLNESGIVDGYQNGEFGLYDHALRAQVAKMVVLAYGLHTEAVDNENDPTFPDVTPAMGSPYPFDYVEEAALNAIVLGYPDGSFGPYDTLTRIQLVRIVVRAAGDTLAEPVAGYSSGFGDVAPEDEAMVTKARYNGLIHGMSATRFNPYGLATRGHVAKVLYSALAQQGEIEKWAKSDMTLAELRALLESELPPTTPVYVPSELPVGWAIAQTGQQFNAYHSNNPEILPPGGPGTRVHYWMYFTNGTSLVNLEANTDWKSSRGLGLPNRHRGGPGVPGVSGR